MNKKYPDKAKVSLWMTKADKQALLNRKHDRDLSLNVFLMRVLRKHVIDAGQKEQQELEDLTGVWGSQVTNQNEPPTNTSNTLLVHQPAATAGGHTTDEN
jgi:hypothetical protein